MPLPLTSSLNSTATSSLGIIISVKWRSRYSEESVSVISVLDALFCAIDGFQAARYAVVCS